MKPNKNISPCPAGNDLVFLCGIFCFLLSFGLGNAADVWAAVGKTSAESTKNYVNEQKLAEKKAEQSYPFIENVKKEDPILRKIRLHNMGLNTEDIEHDYFVLSSPLVNTYEDMYEPVRFMHSKHAASLNNNCAASHHYRPQDPELPEIMPCRSCHQEPFQPEHPKRLGLKAAYHQQCI